MNWLKNTLLMLISVSITLLIIEVFLKLFPVVDVSRVNPLPSDGSALDVSTVKSSQLEHSSNWNFAGAVTRQTNNYGFFSDFDYQAEADGVFAIGDSFVEARQVSFNDTFHQRLSAKIERPVYNIAISGAPLSQYHAYAIEACREFNPSAFVIPIISNDFDESLYESRARAGFFHYRADGELIATPYHLSTIRRMANRSSLVRYLYFHLKLGALAAPGNSSTVDVASKKESDFQGLTTRFMTGMSNLCVPPQSIVFVMDANRYDTPGRTIYTDDPIRLAKMDEFMLQARALGFGVVDLQISMSRGFQETGQRYEFSYDYHWNEAGHALVADEVSRVLNY